MKKEIVFATNNAHKLDEIRAILAEKFEVKSLNDIGCHDEIPEDFDTLEDNAMQKAQYIFDKYHVDCFADDTGLEVEALGGEPGVYSARYAEGTDHNSEANMNKLLSKLEGQENRRARFRTVIALIQQSEDEGHAKLFQGTVNGVITTERSGAEGFGYDPIFRPDGYDKTFAELGNDVKNQISHRSHAVEELAHYLLNE